MSSNRSLPTTRHDLDGGAFLINEDGCDNILRVASSGNLTVSPSHPPSLTPTPTVNWKDELYAADSFRGGMRALSRVLPSWLPVVGFLSALGLYYATFRVRLFISQWRLEERRRAERRYALLDTLRGVPMGPVGAVEPLGEDDIDEEDEDEDDETAVSMRDIEEFRSSLGIRLPRDEDLLSMVERMLMVDPIPDGWVLYRTAAGIIRFMNLNTQELFFFHPSKRKEKSYIDAELKKRNRQAMESKYNFYSEDEGFNLFPMPNRGPQFLTTASGLLPIDFGDESNPGEEDDTQTNAFKRMFHYFLEREQKRIEQDVVRSRCSIVHRTKEAMGAGSAVGVSGPSSSSVSAPSDVSGGAVLGISGGNHNSTSSKSGVGTGGTAVCAESGQSFQRSPVSMFAPMTYRVVLSSAIHGNRCGNSK
ncbi:unnamed protein product [Phytomonas sp. Hart1]|nr:unnamed protein product [Phytomonas sp. Hart1]|eukprot:CCW71672.1 unnamed protein product [Phytomonas sp. isolate Hart1]